MRLYFVAPGATEAQRFAGFEAAEAVFAEAGLSPFAAVTAQFQTSMATLVANPAQLRAAYIWRTALAAAVKACYADEVPPPHARLMVAE